MALFESTLALLLGAVILTGLARRVGVPYPSLLAIAGAVLAFLPAGPELEIEPDLALALFVAPVLLDAAFDTSPRDLRRNVIPLMAVGSPIAGWVLARLYLLGSAHVRDAASSTVLTFVATFGVWLFAERVGLSPIITMVTYGIALAREAPRRAFPRNRVSTYS